MKNKRIMLVFGTRPEAIKLVPVILALRKKNGLVPVVCVTAQHREIMDEVLNIFGIKSDIDLNIMQPKQSLFDVTIRTLDGLKKVFDKCKPDMVLVQGDTTSAFAAALAAFYCRIPVGHVEAGLRTYDFGHPYPEEANRLLIDHIANLLFVPTMRADMALAREGLPENKRLITGNTVIDALQMASKIVRKPSNSILQKVDWSRKIILLTAHRRENWGEPLKNICHAVKEFAVLHSGVCIIYPVHPNPNVSKPVCKMLGKVPNILLTSPLNYFDLIYVMQRSWVCLTDSGGIQEEAPTFGKPILVLRKVTERPEAVEAGVAHVVGTNSKHIFEQLQRLTKPKYYDQMARRANPFGDGKASQRIVSAVYMYLSRHS